MQYIHADYNKRSKKIEYSYINNKNEKKVKRTAFQPRIYEKSLTPTKYKDTKGVYVSPSSIDSLFGYVSFNSNRYYAGDVQEKYQFIRNFLKENSDFNTSAVSRLFFDIEVISDKGFPDPEKAEHELTSIAMYSTVSKKFKVLGYKDFTPDMNTDYIKCENEKQMLMEFWNETKNNCILVGWNSDIFDVVYLVNRSLKNDIDLTKIFPYGRFSQKKVNRRFDNAKETVYDIPGLIQYDYMSLYKKFEVVKEVSYSLDNIAKSNLDEGKVKYAEEHSDLKGLYENDFQKFIEYNIKDVSLIIDIDAKKGFIDLAIEIAYLTRVNLDDINSSIKMWDSLLYNELLNKDMVLQKKEDSEFVSYPGAYVKESQTGFIEWVATYDVNSMYPNILTSLLTTPLSIIDVEKNPELKKIHDKMYYRNEDGAVLIDKSINRINKFIKNEEDYSEILKKNNVGMSICGWFFKRDGDPVASIVKKIYDKRVEYKKKARVSKGEEKAKLLQKVQALKILINSLYGVFGNKHFRFYDYRISESITTTGQYIINYVARNINARLNKLIGSKNKDFIVAIDTDSNMVRCDYIINHVDRKKYNGKMTHEQKKDFMLKLSVKVIEPVIKETIEDIGRKQIHSKCIK